MLSIDLPSCSPEVICHTPSSFFSSVLAAASSPPGDRPTPRRDTPTKIASPQCVRIAYLHALNNGPDRGRLHRFSLDSAWRGSRRATPGRIGDGADRRRSASDANILPRQRSLTKLRSSRASAHRRRIPDHGVSRLPSRRRRGLRRPAGGVSWIVAAGGSSPPACPGPRGTPRVPLAEILAARKVEIGAGIDRLKAAPDTPRPCYPRATPADSPPHRPDVPARPPGALAAP